MSLATCREISTENNLVRFPDIVELLFRGNEGCNVRTADDADCFGCVALEKFQGLQMGSVFARTLEKEKLNYVEYTEADDDSVECISDSAGAEDRGLRMYCLQGPCNGVGKQEQDKSSSGSR